MATKRYEPKDFDAIFAEMESGSDRAAITVGASLLEFALERAIASRLREPHDKEAGEKLFSRNGILSSLSEKTWAAYFLKIIGPLTRREIDLIREIRNQVAHDMNPVSFDGTPQIASRCRELQLANDALLVWHDNTPTARKKYIAIVERLAASLLMSVNGDEVEIPDMPSSIAEKLDK